MKFQITISKIMKTFSNAGGIGPAGDDDGGQIAYCLCSSGHSSCQTGHPTGKLQESKLCDSE